ncbi:MAG: HNH endonuclease [Anaerolineae bacterium]|nr:HNH endonuclease [Anaerolineae bacterium]
MTDYPTWFIQRIKAIRNKRPRIVAEHILEHGSITTEELATNYGYNHPPRAARDLREAGIPLETFRVKNTDGRSIGAYRFGDLEAVRHDRLAGRTVFPKEFKQQIIDHYGSKCAICQASFEPRYLQIDHRIPYEIAGDSASGEWHVTDYMPLCGECNRAKSWSCEHCPNWRHDKNPQTCLTCYWASPESHTHISLQEIRRLAIVWHADEIRQYEYLKSQAGLSGESMPEFVKRILKTYLSGID